MRRVDGWVSVVIGLIIPIGVATAWVPVRQDLPNVDVALALVVVVTLVGAFGRRLAVGLAAACAALSFTFFDTQPYDRLAFSRQPDIATTVGLVLVGVLTGELAVRVARQRRGGRAGVDELVRVRETAALVASGEELVVVIASVAAELCRLLHLSDCWFEAEVTDGFDAVVERDGRLGGDGGARGGNTALPVWGQGRVLGHFLLRLPPGETPTRDQLLVAVTLADQVGAALMVQAPPPPDLPAPDGASPDGPSPEPRAPLRHLHVVD